MAQRHVRSYHDFELRLYVAGSAPNSLMALSHIETLRERLGRSRLEVIDVLRHPRRALQDQILVTPTLVKSVPPPEARIIGNLSDWLLVLRALGVAGDR
jgi:circadian clock protein KaiB